ncbi:MAG: hypothetical protein ABI939_12425 [Anaerolineaceae bacterium]
MNPELEPVVATPLPLTGDGDDPLAAAILGSMAFEFRLVTSGTPELRGSLSASGL